MMSMRSVSKKTLAVLLSMAILASCMVFSFSVSAADTLLWENDFSTGTADNWLGGYQRSDRVWATNTTKNEAVYDTANGVMALKFKNAEAYRYLVGMSVFHQEATNANTGSYGYHGGESAIMAGYGAFRPTSGTYKVTFDYTVSSFASATGASIDLCVGFANRTSYKWDGDRFLTDFTKASNNGVYETVATITKSDAGSTKPVTVTLEQPYDDTARMLHIFAKASNGVTVDLSNTAILLDNIKVYKTAGGAVTPPPSDPDPNAAAKLWENDFNDGTSTNWLAAIQQSDHAWASGKTTNQAVYDTTNKAMSLKFIGETSRNYLSGFTMFHKEATNANTGAYGYHGGESNSGLVQKGMFLPTKDTYTVSFDYKVESFSTTAGAAADICVGFATRANWKWWADAQRQAFINSTNKGVYAVAATVNANTDNEWQSATVVIDQPIDDKMLLHVFAFNHDGAGKNLDGTTILVDNIVVYKGDVTPEEAPDIPAPENTTLMWENGFDNGNSTNWKAAYTNTADNAWYSNSTNNAATYDATNKAMALNFKSANSRIYLSGFAMFHKDATNGTADTYGYHGGETSNAMIQFGAFRPTKARYMVTLNYKVTDFSTAEGAAIDLCVGFAARTSWKWYSDKSRASFIDNTNKGVFKVAATVDASDKADGWQSATITIDQPLDEAMLMHVFARTNDGTTASLEGSTVLVDNVKVYKCKPGSGFIAPDDLTEDVKMWENDFSNPSDTNWKAAYERTDHAWNSNHARNHAIYDAANQAMELKFKSAEATNYFSGFTILHKNATHGSADVAGYHGGETNDQLIQYGMFRPDRWKYTVKLKYKVTSFAETEGAAMDLYVGFADRDNWKWWNDTDSMTNYTSEGQGKGTYFLLATVDASAVGTGWHEVEITIDQNMDSTRLMHIFATGKIGDKKNINGSAVLIDDIEVYKIAPDEDFTNVSFYYEGAKVGQSKKALPGMKFEMPMLDLPTIPDGYKAVYYSDAACRNLVDAPVFYPQVSTDLYVRIVYDTGNAWGFETEPDNTRLSLNQPADTTIHTDDAVTHTGDAAARVDAPNVAGVKNRYPQVMVKNGFGKTIEVGKGRNYEVRFHVYVPAGQSIGEIKYWLTATNDENVFDADDDGDYSSKNFMIAEGSKAITATGQWVEVVVPVMDCAYSGKLRIGIVGDATAAHAFYIDDIAVLSLQSDPNAWGFETEAVGTRLSVNPRVPNTTIYVDKNYVYTGQRAVRVNSDGGSGKTNLLPQMMVKNGAGEQVRVYKNRNYEIKFYVLIPEGQADYDLTYWFTATEEERVFDSSYDNAEYSRKNCTVAAGTADLTVGEWTEVVVTINDCPYSGKLRIGLNGNSDMNNPFYVDELSVNEISQDPVEGTESFELYGNGHTLSLNTDASSIVVSDDDRHNGEYSAKITTAGNDVNAAPQMVVNDELAKPIVINKGMSYRISFWVTQPVDDADYDIKYWFAATDSDAAFTTDRQNVVLDTQTIITPDKHAWQRVAVEINDVAYSGKLRLGITADAAGSHTFYIDDILVTEILPSNMDAMNFENYEVGTNLSLTDYQGTSIIVTDEESYTGSQSAFFHAKENTGDNRPHMNVKDAYGNQVKVKKGDNFYVTFMIMIPENEPYFNLSYWVSAVPDDVLEKPYYYNTGAGIFGFGRHLHVLPGERSGVSAPEPGVWTEIKIPVMDCPRDGNLRIGITHSNGAPFQSNFYIDDIRVYEPEYILVKFDTNGSEDQFDDVLIMSEMTVPYSGIDPYREGYEFLGWYTSKEYNKDAYFDIYNTPVIGKTGDVLTLYAHWRKWDDPVASGNGEKQDKYKTEYYTEKVWVENQTVLESPYPSEEFIVNDAAPIVTTPDKTVPQSDDGLPPWLIVVIIVAAVVVVGGGATLAAILLKKNKKEA